MEQKGVFLKDPPTLPKILYSSCCFKNCPVAGLNLGGLLKSRSLIVWLFAVVESVWNKRYMWQECSFHIPQTEKTCLKASFVKKELLYKMKGGQFFFPRKSFPGQSSAFRETGVIWPQHYPSQPVVTLLTFMFWASQQPNRSASLGSWAGRWSFSYLGSWAEHP